jgi:hypothetical protein
MGQLMIFSGSNGVFAVDGRGGVHVATSDGYHSTYFYRSPAGAWSSGTEILPFGSISKLYSLEVGPENQVYLAWSKSPDINQPISLNFFVSFSAGVWTSPKKVADNYYLDSEGFKLFIDQGGTAQALWLDTISNITYNINYADITVPAVMDTALKQVVAIPAEMQNPTLSFVYKKTGSTEVDFRVNDTPVAVISSSLSGAQQHGWVDLSPWAGQSVEIKFNVHSSAIQYDSNSPTLTIDEVSLGSWNPQVIHTMFIPTVMK